MRSAKPSFAGTGLLERMRSTAVALLGVTTAMALGLVAFAVQQDWPVLPAAPIPGVPEPAELGNARIVAARPGPGGLVSSGTTAAAQRGEAVVRPVRGASTRAPQASHVSGSRHLSTAPQQPAPDSPAVEEAPAASPPPVASAPSAPASAPPANPASAPSVPAVPSPPASEPVAVSGVKDSDDGEDDDQDDDDTEDRGRPYGKSKSHGGWKGGKPAKDDDSDADVVAPAPAPPPPPAQPTPIVPDGAADEEEAEEVASEALTYRGKSRGHGSWP